MNGVNQRGDGATDPDPQRPNQHNGERGGNQHDQHRFEEVFGDRRGNAIDPAFDVRQAPGHHQRRDHGVGVFHRRYWNEGELNMLALRGFRHQLDKARMNQNPCNGDRQRHVGFEFHRCRGRHHQRQEEEGTVANHGEDGERRRAFRQHAGHLKDHRQQFNHRATDDRRDQRRHGADERIQDPGANAAQCQFLWTFR